MATLDCDVSSRLFTLHYCTIVAVAKSDTAAHMGRGDVLYQLTDGPSNDIHTNRLSPYRYLHDRWPQLEPLAFCRLFSNCQCCVLGTSQVMTFRNNLHVTVYIFRCMAYCFLCKLIISIRMMYVNKYTVACNARNSVAYNTTRRRLFVFLS